MLLIYLVLVVLTITVFVYVSTFFTTYRRNKKLLKRIPAPPERPLIGHIYIFMIDRDKLFPQLREYAAKYYPIYRFSTFYVDIVHLLDPDDIEIVLSSTRHLSKSKIYTFLHNWLGTGLLTSTGSKWHARRKILTPAFHFSILQQFLTVFNEESLKLVKRLEERIGEVVEVVQPITHFTLQSIAETAMGLSTTDESAQKEYKKAIYDLGRVFMQRLAKPWYRINTVYRFSSLGKEEDAIVKVLHDFSDDIIKKRETVSEDISLYSKKKRLAMLDLLLTAKKEGADIDYEGIREEVDTFMFEGHDTTAMALSYLLLVLANLPDIQNKVLEEMLQVLGPSKTPTYNELQELKYTERCIKETLRLFPSVPFMSRYASEEFTTKTGYTIPEGTDLYIHIFDLHRDANIYPDPLKFDPDRFLPEVERHPFAYIPFSAGPRNCIGQKFAMLELKAVLCAIVRKFILEKVDDMYSVEFKSDLVLRTTKNVRVKIVSRC